MTTDFSAVLTELERLQSAPEPTLTGTIVAVGDGVITASGLRHIGYLEEAEVAGLVCVALNLNKDTVSLVVLGDGSRIHVGDEIHATGRILSIPVSDHVLGRIINPSGNAIDTGAPLPKSKTTYPLEKIAPGVTAREPVTVPLATGIKAIDCLVPIGRGQRELIIGDRGLGKTSLAIDTIINQKQTGVISIYCAIGQKASRISQVYQTLEAANALKNTVIVAASSADAAATQYLAPYAAAAIAEYFMDQGKDVVVVYDDLTKHAWAYREISLILKRPSGREAYPGDVFYLHSRLLERACRRNTAAGGGSITALPIIETQAGDISAYIPTNVISITDGQIFLEPDLFFQGIRPAISVGLSVSRVGGNAQLPATKQVAGPLRLNLAQFRELAGFAQFSSDLDATTKKQITTGKLLTEALKQSVGEPLAPAHQIAIMYAATKGLLDTLELSQVRSFENRLHTSLESDPSLFATLNHGAKLTPEVEHQLRSCIESAL